MEAFNPDVFLVDNVASGALRELEAALDMMRERGQARCVRGLRDVLDEPAATRREWRDRATEEAIRDYYDAVWIYGDARVFDQVREYGLSAEVAAKVSYTGYVAPPKRIKLSDIEGPEAMPTVGDPEPLVFVP